MERIPKLIIEITPYIKNEVYITFKKDGHIEKMWDTSQLDIDDIQTAISWEIEQFIGRVKGKIKEKEE